MSQKQSSVLHKLEIVKTLSENTTRQPYHASTLELPSQELLLFLFAYDKNTGKLRRRQPRHGARWPAGEIVGTRLPDGRLKVCIDDVEYYVHRVVWKMETGEEPATIDHVDRDPSNNKWNNLRDVDQVRNLGNTKMNKHNTSGAKGVYWAKSKNKWAAQISINNKTVPLGRYDSLEDAIAVRRAAAEIHFGKDCVRE